MATEVWLFILVGAIAVVAAVMLLLSQNAVHAALFLIINMGCIAFLFLLLNAAFLAMVQLAVYAGAIMVLFLFVIMLLGAERPGGRSPYGWLAPGAVVLALIFLVTVALALSQGGISDLQAPPAHPQLRVANLAADAGPVALRLNGSTVGDNLPRGSVQGYEALPPGEYELEVRAVDGRTLLSDSLALEAGQRYTALIYGTGAPELSLVPELAEAGTLRVFNGWGEAVWLVDFASELSDEDTVVLMAAIAPGTLSDPLTVAEDADFSNGALVNDLNEVLARTGAGMTLDALEGGSALMVLAPLRRFEGTLEATVDLLVTPSQASFGSPADIGLKLFNQYMLPMQIVALLLLVAMVGAIVLTHRPKVAPELERARLGRRRVSRPLTSAIASQLGQGGGSQDPDAAALPPAGTQER
ncbi:MAG: NADH-quinone oxidoreductase subunit J [Anaerolineaceae bacterium]|nr:NADH-quinone oxidoreductase subunit J [Anaerolineaceae bacterium]